MMRWCLRFLGCALFRTRLFFLSAAAAQSGGTAFGALVGSPSVGMCAAAVTVQGYKCVEHHVTTGDGYILSLQRIPDGRQNVGGGGRKPPVVLQHGVLVDGKTWLMNQPEQNLPMILAEHGFDVWIANSRGTTYSRRHTTLDPNSRQFWEWSWDEVASYDLPAITDYVFKQTNQKVHYLGHSLGTLTVMASVSEGKLGSQLRSVALLSPIAYLTHMNSELAIVAAKSIVGESFTAMGIVEFNLKQKVVLDFLNSLCKNYGINCYDLLISFTGPNCCLNVSTVNTFLKSEPQSTSTRNLLHLAQVAREGVIARYDFENPAINMIHYGEVMPPVYNLSNIPRNLPLFISYGGLDALADLHDVQELLDIFKLHDMDKLTVQYVKDYGHADFIMGITAKDIVYPAVASFFKRHGL